MPEPEARSRWKGVTLVLIGVAVATRINNALQYRPGLGFDSKENFDTNYHGNWFYYYR